MQSLLNELRTLVDELALNEAVVEALLPNGKPHQIETQLWDYKEQIPCLAPMPTEAQRKDHKAAVAGIIKDAVAFHNALGGYIVFGVTDGSSARVVGCASEFDCGDFNKRLQAFTDTSVECLFRTFDVTGGVGRLTIGVLLIPRRASGANPVRFKKKGPEASNGSRPFNEGTYVRLRDECRPAEANHADWKFLFSDRSPPGKEPPPFRRQTRAQLPARDADLVEFVGREEPLAALRGWISDYRSPVRLITGIGGLGKTTLAYRFAEEVGKTGAGEIEWILWLTAKKQTFSALRGQMVSTVNVDFADLESLFRSVLTSLSYHADDEDMATSELAERVVEALSTYSCLIVVDDIDSLSPSEQKETISALSQIAFRTVGRDIAPSRILVTSRIDQGLAPTAVQKISGLERDAFDRHVANLCAVFKIPLFAKDDLARFYSATSGSPLFASSVVRLVSLGENVRDVVTTWRGQDGEDVREFAFKREIERLDQIHGRLLYAVLVQRESSILDLAEILDLMPKVVRERISELQSYHLISTALRESGDSIITAPDELIAVTEILRKQLGQTAVHVEKACARVQERLSVSTKSIGSGIRSILAAWTSHRNDEALLFAEGLRKKFPKSGDVASILGSAYLRVAPSRPKEADKEFMEARRLGSARPELIGNTIQAKVELEDWQGLYEFTRSLRSNQPGRDVPLTNFLLACSELIQVAKARGDDTRIAALAMDAVERISAKISHHRLDPAYFTELVSRSHAFAREYVAALGRACPRAGDRLRIFEGVVRLSDANVILYELVRAGLNALRAWWTDVEQRPVADTAACEILSRQLARVEKMERRIANFATPQQRMLEELEVCRKDLAHRGAQLRAAAA